MSVEGGDGAGGAVGKIHTGLSPARGNAAAGRRSGIKWLNAFS